MSDSRYTSRQWRDLRLVVLERDGRACRIRGEGCTGEAVEVDHIVSPKLGGGFFDAANLRAACRYCNRSRGGRAGAAKTNSRYPPRLRW